MHPVVGLLRYIPYNLILSQIITGRWGPEVGTSLSAPPNVNSTSVVWQVGCQKNKAELRPLCPFTASHLGTRP
ncbi:hypothetical protein DSO57_1039371, partial [Entomophthora muscae]